MPAITQPTHTWTERDGATYEVQITDMSWFYLRNAHTEHAAQMLTRPWCLKVYRLLASFTGSQGQTVTPRVSIVDQTCRYATYEAAQAESERIIAGVAQAAA